MSQSGRRLRSSTRQSVSKVVIKDDTMQGKRRYYLEFESFTEGNQKNGFLYTLLSFITFWILFSYLVPISLFVTLEIVKFWQGFVFINFDRNMKDRVTGDSGRCRNSNLNEDLGKIDYIFSDKTGTLTSNEMRLRLIAIKGEPLGDLNKCLENRPDLSGLSAIKYFSDKMHNALQVRFPPQPENENGPALSIRQSGRAMLSAHSYTQFPWVQGPS